MTNFLQHNIPFSTNFFGQTYLLPILYNKKLYTFQNNKIFTQKQIIFTTSTKIQNIIVINSILYIHEANQLISLQDKSKIPIIFQFSFQINKNVYFANQEIFKYYDGKIVKIAQAKGRFDCQIQNLLINRQEVFDFISLRFIPVKNDFSISFDGKIAYIEQQYIIIDNYNLQNKINFLKQDNKITSYEGQILNIAQYYLENSSMKNNISSVHKLIQEINNFCW
uniref:Uncharacterized protein n=1 Tax=Spironucleus salmonicida TaxID=348837 RepID=V6LD92_9EUKA|eukprot:EST42198.1 Hypothetical protein SS50377_ee020 [Spironucleus salmonicida]